MTEETAAHGHRLNVGAGASYLPGFTNVDIAPHAEVTLDLSRDRLPFEDGSVDLIFSYHTLEHVDDYLHALGEIHRVLRHGGVFLLGVPYVSSTEFHQVNPYHRVNFSEHSFRFFQPAVSGTGGLKGSAVEENPILFRKVFYRCHYRGLFHLTPPPLRSWCRRHLLNVVRKIDFGLIAVKDPAEPLPDETTDPRRLRRTFRECLADRRTYDGKPFTAPASGLRGRARNLWHWWRGTGT